MLETVTGALASNLHQAQFGDTRNFIFSAITVQRLFKGAQYLTAMFCILHIDKIDNNNTAQIAHPYLPRGSRSGFKVGFVDGLFKIAMTDKGTSIDINGGHGFGLVYHQMATRF